MTEPLSTRYTRTRRGAYLSYQVTGDGPVDLVLLITGSAGIELIWEDPAVSRHIASHIVGARCVDLSGDDHLPFAGRAEEILGEIKEFLTSTRSIPFSIVSW